MYEASKEHKPSQLLTITGNETSLFIYTVKTNLPTSKESNISLLTTLSHRKDSHLHIHLTVMTTSEFYRLTRDHVRSRQRVTLVK